MLARGSNLRARPSLRAPRFAAQAINTFDTHQDFAISPNGGSTKGPHYPFVLLDRAVKKRCVPGGI